MSSSSEAAYAGRCLCGAVQFTVEPPFVDAGRCHCRRCQTRTGQTSSLLGRVPRAAVTISGGADELRVWRPETGNPKWFCGLCGTHLFAGELDGDGAIGIRPGTLDPMPELEPRWHVWVSSMPSWDTLPDDGVPRYDEGIPA
jgi:hypothetical protein